MKSTILNQSMICRHTLEKCTSFHLRFGATALRWMKKTANIICIILARVELVCRAIIISIQMKNPSRFVKNIANTSPNN